MAADPRHIIRILGYHGLAVLLDGDRLAVTPRCHLTKETRRLIARFKLDLIAHLALAPVTLPESVTGTPESIVLAGRLERGWDLIDQEADPARKDHLDDHWLGLLDRYVASHRLAESLELGAAR